MRRRGRFIQAPRCLTIIPIGSATWVGGINTTFMLKAHRVVKVLTSTSPLFCSLLFPHKFLLLPLEINGKGARTVLISLDPAVAQAIWSPTGYKS